MDDDPNEDAPTGGAGRLLELCPAAKWPLLVSIPAQLKSGYTDLTCRGPRVTVLRFNLWRMG